MERQSWTNAQYSRRECLDKIWIPTEVEVNVLEEKVFQKLGCNIPLNRIEACHGVSKKSATVIAKFSCRKDWQHVLALKKDLLKIKMEYVDLPSQNKLFINNNFCSNYKALWSKSKKLQTLGKINSFFISDNTITIKISENCLPLSITHVDDFRKDFPNIDLTQP